MTLALLHFVCYRIHTTCFNISRHTLQLSFSILEILHNLVFLFKNAWSQTANRYPLAVCDPTPKLFEEESIEQKS